MCTTGVIFPLLVLFFILSVSSLLGAIFGHSWWIIASADRSGTTLKGILRSCHYYHVIPRRCEWRQGFLAFDNGMSNGVHLDVVLLLLTISLCSEVVSTLTSITCTCCSLCTTTSCHTKRWWNTGTLTTVFFASVSAITSLCAMAYTEVKLNADWTRTTSQNKDSWSYILGWVAASSSSLCMLLSFLLLYLKPRPGYDPGDTSDYLASSGGAIMKTQKRDYQDPIADYTF